MKHISYISLLISFALVILLGSDIKNTFIVVGQGHFFLAYLYMFKAGKIDSSFIFRYTIVGVLLFGFYFILRNYTTHAENYLRFSTALYFVIHFGLDYYFLNNIKINFTKFITYISPLLIIIFYTLAKFVHIPNEWADYILYAYPLFGLLVIIQLKKDDFVTKQILLFSFVLFLLMYFKVFAFSEIAIIIMAHYITWYIYYYIKVRLDKEKFKTYVYNVLIVNAVFVALFFIFKQKNVYLFNSLFREDVFYLWTWMHYFATLRLNDFKLK